MDGARRAGARRPAAAVRRAAAQTRRHHAEKPHPGAAPAGTGRVVDADAVPDHSTAGGLRTDPARASGGRSAGLDPGLGPGESRGGADRTRELRRAVLTAGLLRLRL